MPSPRVGWRRGAEVSCRRSRQRGARRPRGRPGRPSAAARRRGRGQSGCAGLGSSRGRCTGSPPTARWTPPVRTYRREVQAHTYRIVGSTQAAEDLPPRDAARRAAGPRGVRRPLRRRRRGRRHRRHGRPADRRRVADHATGAVRVPGTHCDGPVPTRPRGRSRPNAACTNTRERRAPVRVHLPNAQTDIARPYAFCVLTLEGEGISAITWFADGSVFPHVGLPRMLR
jgi:hypothetical protein